MKLYTLIACKSGSHSIEDTLISLSNCNIPDSYTHTIIVENGGPPNNQSLVESFHQTLNTNYIHVPEKGKSNALNVALQNLSEGLVFFSDDDVRFDPKVLVAYHEAGSIHGPGHFFGGPFDVNHEMLPPDWLHHYLPPSAKGCWFDESEVNSSFTDFLGFNWAAFVSDLKRTGGFDPMKGPGSSSGSTGQETDMQRRLVADGVEAQYVPGARVTHLVPEESCSPSWALRRSFRSGIKDGINYSRENNHEYQFPPLWLFKVSLEKVFMMAVNLMNNHKYYDSKYWLYYHLGFMKGTTYNK